MNMPNTNTKRHVYLSGKRFVWFDFIFHSTGNIGSGKTYIASRLSQASVSLKSGKKMRWFFFFFFFFISSKILYFCSQNFG